MHAYVGVTDGRWYRFLAARPELSEINFWRPGGRHAISPGEDPEIGCVLIRDPRFFGEDSMAAPPGFAANIVQGKGYDLADSGTATYFGELLQRLIGVAVELDLAEPWHRPGPVFGDPRLAPYRLGQQAFKAVVMDASTSTARSPVRISPRFCRPPISSPSRPVACTVSTMACYSGLTCTPCSTAATSA